MKTVLTLLVSVGIAAIAVADAPEISDVGSGCGAVPPLDAGESITVDIKVGDLEREYRLHLPEGYDSTSPAPLVVVIHGYTGTAEKVENDYTEFSRVSDQNGFVVAYPQGTGFDVGGMRVTSWNDLACSASPGPDGPTCADDAFDYPTPPECGEPSQCDWCTCHDDIAFIGAMLDEIEGTLCIDNDRVFATGISNGGMFVQRLGCDLSDRFAAIAPVAGTLAVGFNCAPAGPTKTSMMNIYATEDDTVPFDGTPASDGFSYTPTVEVMAEWAGGRSQDCSLESTPYPTSRDGVMGLGCIQHANCTTGAEVVECSWNGGHDWPRKGETEFASVVTWEFFKKNGRRSTEDGQ